MAASFQPVDSLLAVPPQISFLNSVVIREEVDNHWAAGGVSFLPERCTGDGIYDPCGSTSKTLSVDDSPGTIDSNAFGIWAGDICSTIDPDFANRELQARANRLLAACESRIIANEFSEGTLATTSSWPNFFLRQPGALVLGTSNPVDALGCLEMALADCTCSGVGLIHATRQVVNYWKHLNLVERVGNIHVDTFGNVVVSDAGYTGLPPSPTVDVAGVSWAYATDRILLRLTQPRSVGGSLTETTDRSVNTVARRAEREAVIQISDCCHAAVGINVEPCLGLPIGS